MKYLDYAITFREFLDEISLCINITGCNFHCKGCHSPELWEDIGTPLNQHELTRLMDNNPGITCIGFMGGVPESVNTLAAYIKNNYRLKVGWYWGGTSIPKEINIKWFDYIKIGPYIEELGGLDNPNTNQRMYVKDANSDKLYDITDKFWKHGYNYF